MLEVLRQRREHLDMPKSAYAVAYCSRTGCIARGVFSFKTLYDWSFRFEKQTPSALVFMFYLLVELRRPDSKRAA